jgi:hypothetical protein
MVAMLARGAQTNQSYLVEHFTAYDVDRWNAIGAVPGANAATSALLGEIGRQAASIGYANDFFVLAAVTMSTVPLLLMLRPRGTVAPTPAATADAGH